MAPVERQFGNQVRFMYFKNIFKDVKADLIIPQTKMASAKKKKKENVKWV